MKYLFGVLVLSGAFSVAGLPVKAQQFTTAAEVRPILEATQANWVAVREYDGKDILYFTHLLAWRCGLEQVEFAVNGREMQRFELEPCYMDEAQPNAIKANDLLPFLNFELKSVDEVQVTLTYDDGVTASATYARAAIMIN
ncbi:hypothetical protein O2N63_10680 [Aliiroseovarius sp. KMU-50]|uniref:Uncharacterized protein n=1 Tax=Aliiroseovarius salicola TaxID=3009082 RepID=A0ABT4W299_9RHOB|nr:hypothetical protein [Aliiroseovarius sp. KMU-50]MDA5094549.1 hypothetical protein [Aliiroseovarius sp. KMU-50]